MVEEEIRRDKLFRELHKIICAECGEEAYVPFKPDPNDERPVYCKKCYWEKRNKQRD